MHVRIDHSGEDQQAIRLDGLASWWEMRLLADSHDTSILHRHSGSKRAIRANNVTTLDNYIHFIHDNLLQHHRRSRRWRAFPGFLIESLRPVADRGEQVTKATGNVQAISTVQTRQ